MEDFIGDDISEDLDEIETQQQSSSGSPRRGGRSYSDVEPAHLSRTPPIQKRDSERSPLIPANHISFVTASPIPRVIRSPPLHYRRQLESAHETLKDAERISTTSKARRQSQSRASINQFSGSSTFGQTVRFF